MFRRKLVFVGTGRSGTTYTAAFCRAHGLDVGHEQVFHTGVLLPDFAPQWGGFDGDASWMALGWPELPRVDDYYIVHVQRDQERTIESYLAIRHFEREYASSPYRVLMERIVPELETVLVPEVLARLWCTGARARAERIAHETVQLEELTTADVERWAHAIGGAITEPVALPPKNLNTRP